MEVIFQGNELHDFFKEYFGFEVINIDFIISDNQVQSLRIFLDLEE